MHSGCWGFLSASPVQDLPIFINYRNDLLNVYHPWREFSMTELTEIMRQKGDKSFLELLNRIRVGEYLQKDVDLLHSRITHPTDHAYPEHAQHLWEENLPVKEHNSKMLDKINKQEYVSIAQDIYPPSVDQARVKKALSRNAS